MKKTITTLALALSLCGVAISQNRSGQMASKPSPDAKLISKTTDGSTQVCRWLVMDTKEDGSNEFMVHYQMNLTKLVSNYEQNSAELQSLHTFLDSLAKSDHKQIKQIDIMGYASPDGPTALNERLANARAADFRSYVNKHYSLDDVSGKTYGTALKWSDAYSAIAKSNVPSRTEVLELVTSSNSATEIEQKLKAIPNVWDYLSQNILPNMRYVDMHVTYNSWHEVVTRTPIENTERRTSQSRGGDTYYFIIMDDNPSDLMLFESESSALDFETCDDRYKYKERSSKRKYRSKMSYR